MPNPEWIEQQKDLITNIVQEYAKAGMFEDDDDGWGKDEDDWILDQLDKSWERQHPTQNETGKGWTDLR